MWKFNISLKYCHTYNTYGKIYFNFLSFSQKRLKRFVCFYLEQQFFSRLCMYTCKRRNIFKKGRVWIKEGYLYYLEKEWLAGSGL